jgi:cytochrome P450
VEREISGRRAVEELLRYDASVQIAARTATEAVTVASANIAAGEQVILLLGSANRDGAVFPAPDRLDLARDLAGRHLAFGSGIHACIGAPLARIEGEIAITALAPVLRRAQLTGAPSYRTEGVLRGLGALPLRC